MGHKFSLSSQKSIILGFTLVAFLLRIYRLDVQSYWIDEAWTLHFANLPLAELFHLLRTEEIHPPFYFPSVNFWRQLVGDTEFALRYYSLIFSVLAVPFTYRLGKTLGGYRLGLIAALLLAVAPFQIWHAQEARMYTVLTAASVMSMWGFVSWWPQGGRQWWLVYVTGTVWTLAAHYHGFVIIGIQGLFLLLTWRQHWRVYLRWGGTLLLILLLYAPWLFYSGTFVRNYTGWLAQPALWQTYTRSAAAYSVGKLVPAAQAFWPTLGFVTLYLLGLIYVTRRRWGKWRGAAMPAFLLSYTIAPNLAAWLFGQLRGTSVYLERYLIPVQVGYLLAVSIGILAIADGLPNLIARIKPSPHLPISLLRRMTTSLLLLTLLATNGWVLVHHYTDPAYAKPNWRAVIHTIEDFSLPGDAILLTGDGGEKLFSHYYRGNLPVYYNFNTPVPPPDEARQRIAQITAGHRRLWFTPYGAPIDALLEQWLAQNSYPAWHRWLGRKRLILYGTHAPAGQQISIGATFAGDSGPGPTLLGVNMPTSPTPAGDLLPLTLTWQTNAPLPTDVQLSLRLINARNDTFAQSDWPPLAAAGGTSTWPTNQSITDRRSLWIPPDTPPGSYLLQLVIYDPQSGQSWGDPATIPNISIEAAQITPPLTALSIPNLTQNSKPKTQNLKLIGYALPDKIQPGREMWLWLYWQAVEPPTAETKVRISLHSSGQTVATQFPLANSVGSLHAWQPGQVRRAVYHLPTSPQLAGNTANVDVALISGQQTITQSVGQIALDTRARQFDPPPMERPANVTFGHEPLLTLIGYNLPATALAPGDPLPLTLVWQAGAEMDVDYTIFVQLLNQAGQVVAQVDTQPQSGAAPTTTWLPGEVLTDEYTLSLPPHLPSGTYRLIAGLYNTASGQRLPVSSGGDFVELGLITVK